MYLALRIIEKLLIIYFTVYFVIDAAMFFYSLYVFFQKHHKKTGNFDFDSHPVSIVVPAYNEEVSILTCIAMLEKLDYPQLEIIIVNDGSTDATMDKLHDAYTLEKAEMEVNPVLNTAGVRDVFTVKGKNMLVIDKHNGGKADAINTGINYAAGEFICTIDADSILDKDALKEVVIPFLENPAVIVSGGQLAVANGIKTVDNKIVSATLPSNIWVQWQIIEYIKSFLISRIALSKINALLIMSGAFSLFRKKDLLQVGGFLSPYNNHFYIEKNIGSGKQTVCEDMEVVVRLWRYKYDNNIKAKAEFLPAPVCWTEVPDNPRNLYKQRLRWHQGLGETLWIHRNMIFEPRYRITGLFGLPYYLFFEFLSPVVKIFTFFFIFAAAGYGIINTTWVLLLLVSVMLASAIIMSSITAIVEYWSNKTAGASRQALRYKGFRDWLQLIAAGITAEFSYSFFKIIAQLHGILNIMQKKHDWRKFERKGVEV